MAHANHNEIFGNYFTPPVWSGYLTFSTNKNAKVFFDTRIEPFLQGNFYQKSDIIYRNIEDYLSVLKSEGTDFILLPRFYYRYTRLAVNQEVEIVYQDEVSVLLRLI